MLLLTALLCGTLFPGKAQNNEITMDNNQRTLLQKHIDEHRKDFFSVNALADELNMSPHYLSDLLRSQTGMNTQQHIHAFLIERAKSLLVTTQLSVSEIAYRLGFEYPQHFNRLFKNKTGITPSEYRNMN